MTIATISEKGQITLPVAARRAVGMNTRDHVIVEVHGDGILIRPTRDLMAYKGFLGKTSPIRAERASAMQHVAAKQSPRS
jgi:AbrB family looped-hinge helix DNA binding protein